LAAGDGKVFLLTSEAIQGLDADSGKPLWRIDRPALSESAVRRLGYSGMYEFGLTVMVYHDGVILLAQPEPNTHHTYHTMPGVLYAFDAGDGGKMWNHAYGGWGHCTPPDVFVIGDTVWTHVHAQTEYGSVWGNGLKALDTSIVDYRIQALDLATGELRRELSTKEIFNVGHHHRCYRNKITERYLMASRRGAEFVDLATGENFQNHWVRSGCLLGNLPANGLLYVAPHPCGCYIDAKLTGFNALAPAKAESGKLKAEEAPRLEKGPAYGTPLSALRSPLSEDWPTYRHDAGRSGATEATVGTDLQIAWQADLGTRPSGLVVARGKVLVAAVDTHAVCALDAEDGRTLWSYTTGARVASPPTFHDGEAIFGSADGNVYCLRASDGTLAWRFSAAPRRRLVTAFGQLESAWPVPGVLVQEGACWLAAGRSSYLDGGIHVYALESRTGKVLHQKTVYSPDAETGKMAPEPEGYTMAGLLNDIPAGDGKNVFIRQMNVSSDDGDASTHLFTTAGYLDSSWFNRTFWKLGRAQTTGLMVLGDGVAYGVEPFTARSRDVLFQPGSGAYRLRCMSTRPATAEKSGRRGQAGKAANRADASPLVWDRPVAIRVTALIRSGDTIFAAGSPDVVDPADPHGAWEGRRGGVLAAFSAATGTPIAEIKLPSPPVWDGMAAAGGRLYLSLLDGSVLCLRSPDS
jgi:outer membrane protein assembly factor BamB